MLSDWDYRNASDDKLDAERRMMEQQRELIRQQTEIYRWKQELERRTPYSPPLTFEQKIDKVISLLEKWGPKLGVLADVMGAMHLDEKDNS